MRLSNSRSFQDCANPVLCQLQLMTVDEGLYAGVNLPNWEVSLCGGQDVYNYHLKGWEVAL